MIELQEGQEWIPPLVYTILILTSLIWCAWMTFYMAKSKRKERLRKRAEQYISEGRNFDALAIMKRLEKMR